MQAATDRRASSKAPVFSQNINIKTQPNLVYASSTMLNLIYTAERVAITDATVLILGENGTGKSEIAQLIHQKSNRATQPFVSVDLGAIPETLFESTLFGHVKGAFTDAKEDRIGRFEEAQGGTIFLDEIGNLSLTAQAKLFFGHGAILKYPNRGVAFIVLLIHGHYLRQFVHPHQHDYRSRTLGCKGYIS